MKKGFSIIEILVVIVISGLCTTAFFKAFVQTAGL
jgi:prepilin-type N-terminal cleavage/methylation domain-containing protein